MKLRSTSELIKAMERYWNALFRGPLGASGIGTREIVTRNWNVVAMLALAGATAVAGVVTHPPLACETVAAACGDRGADCQPLEPLHPAP
jgi:hypothetical protein